MFIGGVYVDPIYLVIFALVAVFFMLSIVIVTLQRYLQVLRSIERATQETGRNTEPMRKLQENMLLLEVHKPTPPTLTVTPVDVELPSDVTQRIPSHILRKAHTYSGQLFANSAQPPYDEP